MHKCLVCGATWGEDLGPDGLYSHGICSECFKERFRQKFHLEQLNYSGIACYAKHPKGYHCPEYNCKYQTSCRSFTEYHGPGQGHNHIHLPEQHGHVHSHGQEQGHGHRL